MFEHLDSALPKAMRKPATTLKRPAAKSGAPSTSTPVTPSKRANTQKGGEGSPDQSEDETEATQPATKKRKTPAKSGAKSTAQTPQQTRTPAKATTTPAKSPRGRGMKKGLTHSSIPDAPAWTLRAIRDLNTAMSASLKRLPPHAYSGLSSILHWSANAAAERQAEMSKSKNKVVVASQTPVTNPSDEQDQATLTLILSIYLIVVSKISSRQALDSTAYRQRIAAGLEALGLPASLWKEVDTWLMCIQTEGWAFGKEWFDNITEEDDEDEEDIDPNRAEENDAMQVLTANDDNDEADEDANTPQTATTSTLKATTPRKRSNGTAKSQIKARLKELGDFPPDDKRKGLLPGLGTMMQPAVDFLSEESRLNFLEFRDSVEKKLAALSKQLSNDGAAEQTETDSGTPTATAKGKRGGKATGRAAQAVDGN